MRLFHPVVVCGEAGCREVSALVDTGASASFIHPRLVEGLRIRRTKYLKPIRIPGETYRCPVVVPERMTIKGKTVEEPLFTEFDTGNDMVLGADIIQDLGLKVDLVKGELVANPGGDDEEKYWRYQLMKWGKWGSLTESAAGFEPATPRGYGLTWLVPVAVILPFVGIPLIWWISWSIHST